MKNADHPISPILDLNHDLSGLRGLTKREYFAAHAPEVPEWFIHTEPKNPKEPKSWTDMSDNDPFKEAAREWFQYPCYDIKDEELKWFQEAWEKFWQDVKAWKAQNSMSRLKQWRYYYADAMLTEEPIPQIPDVYGERYGKMQNPPENA